MFLKPIKQLQASTAFRISGTIAIIFLVNILIFNLTFQPLVREYVLKKHEDLVEYKMRQFRTHFSNYGFDGLIELLQDYHEEANLHGIMVRIVDENDSVLWVTYHDREVADVLKANIQVHTSRQGDWASFYAPAPLFTRILDLIFGRQNANHLVMFKTAKLNDSLTIQVGHTFRYANEIKETFAVIFRYANLLFTTIIFLCSVVVIQLALRPLKDLTKTINKISSGDMSARVLIRNQKSDFGKLSETFNRMLDKTESLMFRMKESLDNVAHDLRTPLSRIRLSIEEAVQKEDQDVLKEAIFDCAEETEKLERLLKTLMDISEAEAETMNLYIEEIDLKELISESAQQYDYLVNDKNIDLEIQLAEDSHILADPIRIRQVLNNLIDNAIKFTPEGGKIEVSTRDNNNSVLLTVKDNGIGISSDDLDHIFDRLYRADKSRSTKGLGLGLSLVKAILQAHHSEIKVQSKPGRGASFNIMLPKNYKEDSTLIWKNEWI